MTVTHFSFLCSFLVVVVVVVVVVVDVVDVVDVVVVNNVLREGLHHHTDKRKLFVLIVCLSLFSDP